MPLPVAHVARNMGLTRQAVQRVVNEMEHDGLVRFESNAHHRRAKLVLLTARGNAAYDAAAKRQRPWALKLAEGLRTKQIKAATATLLAIRQCLDKQVEQGNRDA